MVREVASKTSDVAATARHGDRSGAPDFQEGVKTAGRGANPMALKARHREGRREGVEAIKEQSKPVKGDAIAQVGTVSATATRPSVGIIAEAMKKVGKTA